MFEKFDYDGDFQGNPVINYCQESVPFTRITEHKHFAPWESHQNSICFREYSLLTTKNLDPYYPLRLLDDINVLQRYIEIIENTSKITFIGRLGTYRYLDMHVVINESLKLAEYCLSNSIENWPKFSVKPL
jgi:UDP-galactopyranose mutase